MYIYIYIYIYMFIYIGFYVMYLNLKMLFHVQRYIALLQTSKSDNICCRASQM